MATKEDILEYAREAKAQRPSLTDDELRGILRARFVDGSDPIGAAAPMGGLGAINNPLDWVRGLAAIFRGIARLWGKKDVRGVMDIIEGVVLIVQKESK